MSLSVQGLVGKFLVDTGASRSVLSRAFISRFKLRISIQIASVELRAVTGQPVVANGEITLVIDRHGRQKFLVLPELRRDGILGSDFLQDRGASVDYERGQMIVGQRHVPISHCTEVDQYPILGEVCVVEPDVPVWVESLRSHPAFRDELGVCTVGDPVEIITEGPPIKQQVQWLPLVKRKQVDVEVDKMLAQGIIRPSQSHWASPVTLVPKRDGTTRFCVDFRAVNDITRKDGATHSDHSRYL